MKVCFFLGGLTGGGIGRVTAMIANELKKKSDFDITILSYSKKEEFYAVVSHIKKDYLLSAHMSMSKAILKGAVGKLRSYIQENEIDVIIGCGIIYSTLAILACHGTKAKVLNWEHSSMAKVNNDFKFQTIVRAFAAKRADLNIVLTKKTKSQYISTYHLNQKKVIQIYNPVDPAAFKSNRYKAESMKIVTVGRLCFQKRMEDIIPIADSLKKAGVDFRWDIYGDGEEREKLAALISSKFLNEYVVLKGRVSDMYDRYGDYACITMTSRYEGFPMTLLEAAANGLPMVSYDIETGPNEIILDGRNGYLIPSGDLKQMTEKLKNLLNNKDIRVGLADGSRETAKEFSLDSIIRVWVDMLNAENC